MTQHSNFFVPKSEIMVSLSNLSDFDFLYLFMSESRTFLDCQIELKNYLNKINNNDFFTSLDCYYYNCDQFITKYVS